MSRAFVKESDGDADNLPERALSTHPNFVTARGLSAIEAQVRQLEAQRQAARAADDTALRTRLERELRYWSARRASARLVAPTTPAERVRFGMQVRLQLASGASQVFRLVGEDEADAAQGLLSWVSPLAQALLGREVGDAVAFQGAPAEIVSIEP
jgi:transcription elongation GreA/GreB family factor